MEKFNLDYAVRVNGDSPFLDMKIKSFHSACEYVWQLPYGRTTEPYDYKLVLLEGRGTCSSKPASAFGARLLNETRLLS